MKHRANLGHFLIIARGIDAIGEQHHEKFAVGINPDGSAGKSGVPETMCGEKVPAGPTFGWNRPPERACTARKLLRRGKLRDGGAPQNAKMRIAAAVYLHLAKC